MYTSLHTAQLPGMHLRTGIEPLGIKPSQLALP